MVAGITGHIAIEERIFPLEPHLESTADKGTEVGIHMGIGQRGLSFASQNPYWIHTSGIKDLFGHIGTYPPYSLPSLFLFLFNGLIAIVICLFKFIQHDLYLQILNLGNCLANIKYSMDFCSGRACSTFLAEQALPLQV